MSDIVACAGAEGKGDRTIESSCALTNLITRQPIYMHYLPSTRTPSFILADHETQGETEIQLEL